jgi:hypothetical protein
MCYRGKLRQAGLLYLRPETPARAIDGSGHAGHRAHDKPFCGPVGPPFSYGDEPNHLARYTVIERILWGEGSQDYSFHWIPTSYIGVDLFGAGLVHLFGPTAFSLDTC